MQVFRIYKCTNLVNGKTYIGFTQKPLSVRIREHISSSKNGSNYLLHKAIRKYGFYSFQWETIYESLEQNSTLNTMENHFIMENKSYYETGLGYNMTFGGQGGMTNKKHTEETKQKLKNSRSKRSVEPMLGKKHSEETKQKQSLAKKGKKKTEEYKSICSERNKKRYQSEEQRKKMSDSIKLMWQKRKLSQQLGA
jgi:group I intron endonuclease